jgi:hypothetical protein
MRRWMLIAATAICLGGLSLAIDAKPAQADDYWDGYWGWYDGTYRPYVTRRYYGASPVYPSPYSAPYYGPAYGYYPGDRYYPADRYYGSRYYGDYYGTRDLGYRDVPGAGGQVRVGPLRFGWR